MDNSCFWCQNCQRKFFVSSEYLITLPRSPLMKKPPFLDHEKTMDKRSELKMENRKKMVKCAVCGHVMKEVENGGSKSPDISS
jgi:Zn finger protein HypA/HybF involved in hydrogenase expression